MPRFESVRSWRSILISRRSAAESPSPAPRAEGQRSRPGESTDPVIAYFFAAAFGAAAGRGGRGALIMIVSRASSCSENCNPNPA